jgi:hypothetical protein
LDAVRFIDSWLTRLKQLEFGDAIKMAHIASNEREIGIQGGGRYHEIHVRDELALSAQRSSQAGKAFNNWVG